VTIKTLDKKSNNDTSNDSTVNSEQKQVYNPDFKSETMVKMLAHCTKKDGRTRGEL
jgi:hypothetical protein